MPSFVLLKVCFPVRSAGCCRISWWKHPPSFLRFCKASRFFYGAELSFTRENHWLLQPPRTSVGGLTAARSDVVETFCRPKKLTQQRKVIKLKKKLRLQSTNQPPSCSLLWTRHRVSLTATRVPCGTGRRGCWELCQTVKLDKTMHLSIVILPMMWRCC